VLLAILGIVLLVVAILQARQLRRVDERLTTLTQGQDGRNLDTILEAYFDKVLEVTRGLDELTGRATVLEANAQRALQRVGLVRFNPFEDTGGNQSFALALLDARDDGFIISSLHTRTSTRIYARALVSGRAEGGLSDEESQALAIARSAPPGRVGLVDQAAAESVAVPAAAVPAVAAAAPGSPAATMTTGPNLAICSQPVATTVAPANLSTEPMLPSRPIPSTTARPPADLPTMPEASATTDA